MSFLLHAVMIGMGATAIMDLAAVARQSLGTPAPDYGLVGRWLAYMPRGRFRHHAIAAAPAIRNEKLIGWIAHYLTGIGFAGALLGLFGLEWARHPTPVPALAVGIASVATPFLVMQPGMGLGIAARKAPRPGTARLRSLISHATFGFGLYLSGLAVNLLAP